MSEKIGNYLRIAATPCDCQQIVLGHDFYKFVDFFKALKNWSL
jgi:hypothetical protein